MSVRQAAGQYNVPKSTLHDRSSGKVQPGAVYGKQPVLSYDVEESMATSVKEAASQGFGITRQQLMLKAGQIARRLKLTTPFRDGVPGDDWLQDGFLRRNT